MDKIETKRLTYEYNGRKIYEWDQTLSDLNMYIDAPPGTRAKHLDVKIGATQLTIGLKGNPPFIDEPFTMSVNSSESTWTLEDGILHLSLTKGSKGTTWESLLKGHTANDPWTQTEVQKSLMLERFQAEVRGARVRRRRWLSRRASRRSTWWIWPRLPLVCRVGRACAVTTSCARARPARRTLALIFRAPASTAACPTRRRSWVASATTSDARGS